MSHYRNLGGGRRDKNEPEIMRRFRLRGWHPEQVSGNRLWDLNAYPPNQQRFHLLFSTVAHVDVKMPDGKVTSAQEQKWKALAGKGIPVYVVRTAEDVDALVRGELAAWEPAHVTKGKASTAAYGVVYDPDLDHPRSRKARSGYAPPRFKPVDRRCPKGCGKHGWDTTNERTWRCSDCGQPPDTAPVDAAKEAEETFAPPCTEHDCKVHR